MEEGRTQNSKSWEEEIYWSHFQFIHFTLFLHTTDFQQQLALPKTFSDNLKKKLPENVTLKGPSGVVWNIGLNTRGDTVYFVDGWQRFVKDHSLKENDFLVFKYNGESLFEVLIFNGESFCEKAASYFVLECGQAHAEQGGNKGKNSNNFVEEVNTPNGGVVECASPEKFRSLDSIRTSLALTFETTNRKTFNVGFKSASPDKPVKEVTPVQTKKRARTPKEANSWERACNKEHSEAALSKLSRKLSRNDEEKIAQSFTSSVPYFVKIIKTFHVGGSCVMNIPRQFSMAHLKKGKIKIILHNMKGECWTVNSVPTAKVPKSHTLCAGWMSFVHANSIKVGDVCIFELISDCELRVRIAEVGKEGLDCQVGKEGLDHPNEHVKLNSI